MADNPAKGVQLRNSHYSKSLAAWAVCTVLIRASLDAQISAKQGEKDPTEFSGSMVLEAPFPPALPGNKVGEWYTTADYSRMRLYRCDRVYIAQFQFKVEAEKKGTLPVTARVMFHNPEGNHDKNVELLLEVVNGDQKVMEARRTIRVEESDMVGREIGLPVPAASLKAEPTTQLRITVRTKDV